MKYTNYLRKQTQSSMEELERFEYFSSQELEVRKYEGGVVVPSSNVGGGGLYCDGKYVEWSNFNGKIAKEYDGACDYVDEDVLYLGMMFGVWGHCLTDFMSHAWPLLGRRYSKIVYTLVMPTSKIPDNYFGLLAPFGVERESVCCITRPTRFRSVSFGDPSVMSPAAAAGGGELNRYYTKEYDETIERICSYYNAQGDSADRVNLGRVYLSRSGWKKGCVDFGEELVEEAFERYYGCKVIRPEKLSLGELVRTMSNCETLVSTEGSVAHNSLFLKKGSNLISLRKGDYPNGYQTMINQVRDLNVTYIDSNYTYIYPFGDAPWFGPFLLAVNERLARFLNCEKTPLTRLFKPFCCFTMRYVYSRTRSRLSRCKRMVLKLIKN